MFTHHINARSSRSPVIVYPRLTSTMVQVRLNRLQHALPRLDEDGFVESIVSHSVSQSVDQGSRSFASPDSFGNVCMVCGVHGINLEWFDVGLCMSDSARSLTQSSKRGESTQSIR